MFARMLEFNFRTEYKRELLKKAHEEVLPILRKQTGFFDVLWFQAENEPNKFVAISLWTTKADAERYDTTYFPKVRHILEPFLTAPPNLKWYNVDTTFSEAIVGAFAA